MKKNRSEYKKLALAYHVLNLNKLTCEALKEEDFLEYIQRVRNISLEMSRVNRIRSTPKELFNSKGNIDKRRRKRANRKEKTSSSLTVPVTISPPSEREINSIMSSLNKNIQNSQFQIIQ